MSVYWKSEKKTRPLYVRDLELGESFKIASGRAKGAVYMLVKFGRYSDRLTDDGQAFEDVVPEYQMLEYATGRLYDVTLSPVERVSVEVNIDVEKPTIY